MRYADLNANFSEVSNNPRKILGQIGESFIAAFARRTVGENIIDCHLPGPGTPTQGVEAGYMANAWIRMRHPDFDELRRILDDIGRTLRLRTS